MIKIINQSKDFDKRETYKMTLAQDIEKVSDFVGEHLTVCGYIHFIDEHEDKSTEILSIIDQDGRVYASNSETFRNNLFDMWSIFAGEPVAIQICKGTSKNGREFMYCTLD